MHHVTITTKTIAVQTLILEDAADTEDNILNMTEAYSTILALCQMLGYSPYESSLAPIIVMVGAILFAQK